LTLILGRMGRVSNFLLLLCFRFSDFESFSSSLSGGGAGTYKGAGGPVFTANSVSTPSITWFASTDSTFNTTLLLLLIGRDTTVRGVVADDEDVKGSLGVVVVLHGIELEPTFSLRGVHALGMKELDRDLPMFKDLRF